VILSLVILGALCIASLWVYWRSSPTTERRGALLAYDVSVALIVAGLAAGLALHLRASLATGPDRAWWPVLATLGAIALVPPSLTLAALLRNLLLFRPGSSRH